MSTSLYSNGTQNVLNSAEANADRPAGPFASPQDWRDLPIYFLMMDRFNHPGAQPKQPPFDNPNFSDFQGGTFSGVRQQLKYIRQLGAGAIWLSPVLKNLPFRPTYHGYGIHDFMSAEPRFADNPAKADDELRALVDAAHEEGLYVIFDIVLNHTGDGFAYPCDPNDLECSISGGAEASFHSDTQAVKWRNDQGTPTFGSIEKIPGASADALVWPSELQKDGFFRRQGKPQNNADDTVGDFDSLKQMMTDNPELQAFLIRSFQYVMARFDVDGFRIDTIRYLKGDLARLFGNAIREFALSIGKRNFFTFGEVADDRAEQDIARFIGRNAGDGGDLVGVDAAIDYPLFNSLKGVVKSQSPPSDVVGMYQFRKQIEKDILSSHGDATRFFVTFLDNHDVKQRLRYVDPGDPNRFDDQVSLGMGCLFTLPGIPCVYYGTEQGLHGSGSDEAVRECLWAGPGFNQSSPFYTMLQSIAAVRSQQPALRYGRFYFRPLSGDGINFGVSSVPGGVIAYSRILNDQEVLVVANTNVTASQTLSVIVDQLLSQAGDVFRVLYSNKALRTAPGPVEKLSNINVQEVDGSISHGPLHAIHVILEPMEIQILRK